MSALYFAALQHFSLDVFNLLGYCKSALHVPLHFHWCDQNGKYKPTLRSFENVCIYKPVATKDPLGIKGKVNVLLCTDAEKHRVAMSTL